MSKICNHFVHFISPTSFKVSSSVLTQRSKRMATWRSYWRRRPSRRAWGRGLLRRRCRSGLRRGGLSGADGGRRADASGGGRSCAGEHSPGERGRSCEGNMMKEPSLTMNELSQVSVSSCVCCPVVEAVYFLAVEQWGRNVYLK